MVVGKIQNKALRNLFNKGDKSGLDVNVADKIESYLTFLNASTALSDAKTLPGFHLLKGDRKGVYAVTITKNWRLCFKFKDGEYYDITYEDYH